MTPMIDAQEPRAALERLQVLLAGLDTVRVAIAVSGGIDSLTLSAAAAPVLGERLTLHHATSPAVPHEATERTRALAAMLDAKLVVFDAGEFDDPSYRANPANRCFFCKTNLYGAIATRLRGSDTLVLSGTNTDDLSDYRPGLQAADTHGVRHPFVEAAISKATLRRIAPLVGLGHLADLPSAPCLSSRIETGLFIEPATLALVHAVERSVAAQLGIEGCVVRCRVRRDGLVIELDGISLQAVQDGLDATLRRTIAELVAESGEPPRGLRFAAYRTGSAFLRPVSDALHPAQS
ncbi:MAG: hypothetical protein ACRYGI_11925 [Janthinobacterium lividum]